MAGNWTESEIEAIVKDYFDMLRDEQRGLVFNKSEHRRALVARISRTPSAIERKHMNISAVMNSLGLPHIHGYQPYDHYQKALFEAVQAYLQKDPDLYAYLVGENLTAAQEPPNHGVKRTPRLEYASPPNQLPDRRLPDEIRQIVGRFEPPAERDARIRSLGRAGEQLVFAAERERLLRLGQSKLSERVRWVARDDGDGCGFDILSFAGEGEHASDERWLEVKTTNGPNTTPFFITKNELRVSNEHADVFRVVRLYNFRRLARAYCLEPPLEHQVELAPMIYSVSLREAMPL